MISARGHNGTVHFDGQFVSIERTGFVARSTVGRSEKRIPLRSIQAVQWKPPGSMIHGYIEFTIAGGREFQARRSLLINEAAGNENAVVVRKSQAPAFEALRNAVEAALAGSAHSYTPNSSVGTQPPPPSSVPAGWYPDPGRSELQRYWDGARWTEHTAPRG
jgi:uncharacterized protein DUF2510/uncharacterized protein DUF4429